MTRALRNGSLIPSYVAADTLRERIEAALRGD